MAAQMRRASASGRDRVLLLTGGAEECQWVARGQAVVGEVRACGWSHELAQKSDWWKLCDESKNTRTRMFFLRLVRAGAQPPEAGELDGIFVVVTPSVDLCLASAYTSFGLLNLPVVRCMMVECRPVKRFVPAVKRNDIASSCSV